MERTNLLITSSLTGIIVLTIAAIILIPTITDISTASSNSITANEYLLFNNSTPEAVAISIARLNSGKAFNDGIVDNVSLTPDEKYWIVNLHIKEKWNVTIDAKTLMSKEDDGEWKSLDELKATYIADIQSDSPLGKPQKITMNSKVIWKIPVYHEDIYENGSSTHEVTYVYVDLKTGKSKSTWGEFNRAAGTNGWLTLKEVDYTSNKMILGPPSGDALRDLYPE
ncbi:MAG TPA: hypothetical protein VHO92_04290 [Methanobacterium sp.]|nr:hypothetical protein [Methanobacterium sp.]